MKTRRPGPIPSVIRSRQHLISQGNSFLAAGAMAPTDLPMRSDGVTYSMAQEVAWLDSEHFAVGRWDGTLSIFAFNESSHRGPVISKAVNTPALEGVQMITWLAPRVFCSSNDEQSMVVWASSSESWRELHQVATLVYDAKLGVVNSGDSAVIGGQLYMAAGHANGFISLWKGRLEGTGFQLAKVADLRNPNPTNPWGLHNIRGIATVAVESAAAYIATGSEDGYLCILRLPDCTVLSQTVYNSRAQRGINSVAALGNNLLVANCAVGEADKNLWYFSVNTGTWKVDLKDSANLRVNPSAPQVFNFCAIWGWSDDQPCFFSSTEEGALWMGTIGFERRFKILGYQTIFGELGSALAFHRNGNLVAINYNLYEFKTNVKSPLLSSVERHPERLFLGSEFPR